MFRAIYGLNKGDWCALFRGRFAYITAGRSHAVVPVYKPVLACGMLYNGTGE